MTVTEIFADEDRVIEREATAEEIQQREETAAYFEQLEEEKTAKAAARAALLERLGITEDEAKLLLA